MADGTMGSTGTVNVSPEMLKKAKDAVDTYRKTVSSLNSRLVGVIDNLIPTSFSGSAANGFKAFYDTNIEPTLTTDLNELLATIDSISDGILQGIPDATGIDEQLSEENINAMKGDN